ncbi:hypothetical protein ACFL6K_00800 [Candidatus Latescibacterota bacterium]
MNIPDVSSSKNSSQIEPVLRDENLRKVQMKISKSNLPATEETKSNKDKSKDQPDKFIQSAKNVASAVYNVRDVSKGSNKNTQSKMVQSKKVLDVILPMGRKRLRIFLEG